MSIPPTLVAEISPDLYSLISVILASSTACFAAIAPNNAVREKLLLLGKLSCSANCSLVCLISPTLITSL